VDWRFRAIGRQCLVRFLQDERWPYSVPAPNAFTSNTAVFEKCGGARRDVLHEASPVGIYQQRPPSFTPAPSCSSAPSGIFTDHAIGALRIQLGPKIIRNALLDGEGSDPVPIKRYGIVKPTRDSGHRSLAVTGV
jgi:hypothetical protein